MRCSAARTRLSARRAMPVLFKTSADRREALMSRIAQGHDYDIPAILSWPVEAVPGYAQWVAGATQVF
jgi:periplasmic divalent cation tolerance protein